MTETLLTQARALDAIDPLAEYVDRFVPAEGVRAYLDGNSLGRPLRVTAARLQQFVAHDWGTRLIRSWDEQWIADPERVGDRIASVLLGAAAGQTVVSDSTSVSIYKLAHAALTAGRAQGRNELVVEVGNFPTDRFIAEGLARELGAEVRWIDADPVHGVSVDDVAAAVGERTALVLLSHVDFRSGAVADMPGITAVVRAAGAFMMWDLCHSVGVLPMQLDEWGVDLAVGCTYKYLNGGPGSPAFMYVAARHHGALQQPIWGWWSAANVFEMGPSYERASGIRQFLSGTPPITNMIGMQGMVDLIEEVGITQVRDKSRTLTSLAIDAFDRLLAPLGASLLTPREFAARGSHVSVGHPRFADVIGVLWQGGVIPDFRNPDNIRLGLSPLSTTHEEVVIAIEALARELTRELR